MLPLGHLAGAYLFIKVTLRLFKNLSAKEKRQLLLFGTFVTLLPDLDLFYPLLKFGTIFTKKDVFDHHTLITHSLFFYLILSLIIYLYGSLRKKNFVKIFSLVFFAAIFSHLILDSFFIDYGPMWLYPFSQKNYGFIFPFPEKEEVSALEGLLSYFSHFVFHLEILLFLIALTVFIKKPF